MTEDDARAWVDTHFGSPAVDRLTRFVTMLAEEMQRQNLIAPSTLEIVWSRHLVDSLQLGLLAGAPAEQWLDIGTGAGFPGLVLAMAIDARFLLVEPRRRRVDFLQACADALGLDHVEIPCAKVEQIARPSHIITARAVASIEKLLQSAAACATAETRWLLPRGAVDPKELRGLDRRYGLTFHVEQSLTAADSSIVIADGAKR